MFEFLIAVLIALLPACADETSAWCYWDASTQGNGEGRSFIDIGGVAHHVES